MAERANDKDAPTWARVGGLIPHNLNGTSRNKPRERQLLVGRQRIAMTTRDGHNDGCEPEPDCASSRARGHVARSGHAPAIIQVVQQGCAPHDVLPDRRISLTRAVLDLARLQSVGHVRTLSLGGD